MKKSFNLILCVILALTFVISGCSSDKTESSKLETTSVQETTQVATTVPNVSTNDTAEKNVKEYDSVLLKQKADEVISDFDTIISSKKYNGATYMKIENDFEYIKTSGFSNAGKHVNNSINTCYYTGSVTKQFTATAVMQLKEQGKLSLDDTLKKYFPSYKYADKITVRNLLTMTSGIKNYVLRYNEEDDYIYLQPDLENKISEDNSENEIKEKIVNWILSQDLNFEPDTEYSYSDSNYYLLGKVIEKASGKTYEKYISENILKPLGLSCSGFTGSEHLSKSYQGYDDCKYMTYLGVGYSSSGLISNVSDLLKWTDGLFSYQILSEDSVKEMFTPNKENYGYGVYISGNRISVYGNTENYSSSFSYTTDKSEIFVSLTNYCDSDPVYIYSLFRQALSRFYK